MATLTAKVVNTIFTEHSNREESTQVTIIQLDDSKAEAVQSADATANGVACQRYGVFMVPYSVFGGEAFNLVASKDGKRYITDIGIIDNVDPGTTITFNEEV